MSVTIYHNPRCGKSRQTLELLRRRGIEPTVVEYLKTPPSAAELKKLLAMLGMTPRQLLRPKEAAAEGVDATLPDDKLIAAMVSHPIVIERPIVVNGGKAALGRPPEAVEKIVGKAASFRVLGALRAQLDGSVRIQSGSQIDRLVRQNDSWLEYRRF